MSQQVEPRVTVACHCPVVYPLAMPHISEWEALSQQLLLLFKVMLLHEGTGILPESDLESLGTSMSTSSATSTLGVGFIFIFIIHLILQQL